MLSMGNDQTQGSLPMNSVEMEEEANEILDSKKRSVSSQICIYLCERTSKEKFTTKSLCEEMGFGDDERFIGAASATISMLAHHKHRVLKVVGKTPPPKGGKGGRGSFIYEVEHITQMPKYNAYASAGGKAGRKNKNRTTFLNLPLMDGFMSSTSIKSFEELKKNMLDLSKPAEKASVPDLSKVPPIRVTIPEKDWKEQMDQQKDIKELEASDELEGVDCTIKVLELLRDNSSGEIADSADKLLKVAEAQKNMMEQIQKNALEIETALQEAALSLQSVSSLKIDLSSLSVDQLLKALRTKYREQQ